MKTVVVIGGSSGYGLGIATRFYGEGWRVEQVSRTITPQASLQGNCCRCDVTDPLQVARLFNDIVAADMVVYSAGIAIGLDTIKEGNPANWERVFKTNVLGLMSVAKHAFEVLSESKGVFVHIGSLASSIQYAGAVDYCASKAAAASVMAGLRLEWAGSGVRTCSIEPGLGSRATNFQRRRYDGDEAKMQKHFAGIRPIEPADLAATVWHVANAPEHINFDSILLKPLDQASHGKIR